MWCRREREQTESEEDEEARENLRFEEEEKWIAEEVEKQVRDYIQYVTFTKVFSFSHLPFEFNFLVLSS